jgi:hypothetical protein
MKRRGFLSLLMAAPLGAVALTQVRPAKADDEIELREEMPKKLVIEGVDPGSMFSGRQVRELVDAMNSLIRDGAK